MYHQFISNKYKTLNCHLQRLFQRYISEQQKRQKQQSEQIIYLSIRSEEIIVQHFVHNLKFNTIILFLSCNKVLRCDLSNQKVYELGGLQDISVREIKPLEINGCQKYIVLADDGIYLVKLPYMDLSINKQTKQEEEKDQPLIKDQIIEKQSQMQQQNMQQDCCQVIECEIEGRMIMDYLKNPDTKYNNQNSKQYIEMLKKLFLNIKSFLFIVNSPVNNKKTQTLPEKNEPTQQIQINTLYLNIIVSPYLSFINFLIVLKLSIQIHNKNTPYPKQKVTFEPILLPNQKYRMQFALTNIQLPIPPSQQQINPFTITQSNNMYSQCNPIIYIDQIIHAQTQRYSIYFITQSIIRNAEENGNEQRHVVFQYQVQVLNDGRKTVMSQETNDEHNVKICSPIFQYPQKKVICPSRVFHLPISSSKINILKHIKIKKQIVHNNNSKQQQSSLNYQIQNLTQNKSIITTIIKHKFTTIHVGVDNNIEYQQLQLLFEHPFSSNNKINIYLNEQNIRYKNKLSEKIVIRQLLYICQQRKYAIVLANQSFISNNKPKLYVISLHNHNHTYTDNNNKEVQNINKDNTNLNTTNMSKSNIICTLDLDEFSNSNIDFLSMDPVKSHLQGQRSLFLIPNKFRKQKQIKDTTLLIKTNNQPKILEGKQDNISPIISQIKLINKSYIYVAIINRLMRFHSLQESKQGMIKQEKLQADAVCDQEFIKKILTSFG